MKNKNVIRFKNYMVAQSKYVETAKYYEGINSKRDPGDGYTLNWINYHAEEFRKKWETSKCKNCIKAKECGDKLKKQCGDFSKLVF